MKRAETTNTFQKGLMTDFNPLVTPDGVTTNCLNGTLITANGNENVLQNDLGNARVETARLPEGFIPLGTAELGGIIYIVSYNPLKETCQIGSFPSPERNITSDEIDDSEHPLNVDNFYADLGNLLLKTKSLKVELTDFELNPGDKFKIGVTKLNSGEISGFTKERNVNINPKYLKLKVVALQDNGEVTDLSQNCVWYYFNDNYDYYLYPDDIDTDFQDYRDLIKANFNTFQSKISGKLGIIAELECIDDFDVTWDARKFSRLVNSQPVEGWLVYFFTNWTYSNEENNNRINLNSIKVQYGDTTEVLNVQYYPTSGGLITNTDINKNSNITFYSPDEKTVDDITTSIIDGVTTYTTYENNTETPRRNDGTDNQFLIQQPIEITDTGKIDFTITPGMPFGYMDWQQRNLSIDFDKLGSGECSLIEYRYYYNRDGSIKLNWGLEAYPERGTEINEVKFNFYEFNKNNNSVILLVLDSVSDSVSDKSLIDNYYKTATSTWVSYKKNASGDYDTVSRTHNLPKPTVPITATKRTSYSGNLTENITELDSDKLYLLEIEVPFVKTSNKSLVKNQQQKSGLKTIKYYRLMYTCPIFNNYYYEIDDYKDIILQDAIDKHYPLQVRATNVNITTNKSQTSIINSSNQAVTEIPGYLLQSNSESKSYTVKLTDTKTITHDIEITNGLPIFDFSFDNQTIQYTPSISDNSSKQVLLKNASTDSNMTILGNISYSFSNSSGETITDITSTDKQISFTLNGNIPLVVDYSQAASLTVTKQLVPLTTTALWWSWEGRDKGASYMIRKTRQGEGVTGYAQISENQFLRSYLMKDYATMYSKVEEYLETNDVVVLCVSVNSSGINTNINNNDKNLHVKYGPQNEEGTINEKYITDDARFRSMDHSDIMDIHNHDENSQPVIFIYAIKGYNQDINFYTFGVLRKNKPSTWFSIPLTIDYPRTDTRPIGVLDWITAHCTINSATADTYTETLAKCAQYPFWKYYKVQNVNQIYDGEAVEWAKVYYYNDYIYTIDITGQITQATLETVINGVDVNTSRTAIPLNLQYVYKTGKNTISISTNNRVSVQPYLNMVQSGIINTEIVDIRVPVDKDGNIQHLEYKELTLDSSLVYDINANPVERLKVDFGQVLPYNTDAVKTENLKNAGNVISMTRGSLAANIDWGAQWGDITYSDGRKKAQFVMRLEDQAAAVKYINMIPDPIDYIQL